MNKENPLAEQSKEWLCQAFFNLLEKRDYDEISVKDISLEAGLARRTFYRAFKNKDDMLEYYGRKIIDKYIQELDTLKAAKMNFDQVLNLFFNFWWQQREQVRLLIKKNLFINLLAKITPQSPKLYEYFHAPWHLKATPQQRAYIMSFSVGGFWNVLNSWLAKDEPEEPEEMAGLLIQALRRISDFS